MVGERRGSRYKGAYDGGGVGRLKKGRGAKAVLTNKTVMGRQEILLLFNETGKRFKRFTIRQDRQPEISRKGGS
jgi:hypothetical protein